MVQDTGIQRTIARCAVLTAIAGLLVMAFSRVPLANRTTIALSFLVLILFVAYRWRLAVSLYLSILCTVLYNVFFLPPIGRLTISDPQNWVALASFLLASVLVSHLSERERRQAETSEARRHDVELLYRLSQRLLVQDEVKELARSTPSILAAVFGFRAVALYAAAADVVFYSDPDKILVASADLKGAELNAEELVTDHDGMKIIQLRIGMQHALGRLAVTDSGLTTSMYEAIGSLVSVALERAAALERTSRVEAARESERLRSALVDSVTHDLRTPLTAIRAAATTLQGQPEMPELERNDLIAVVEEESKRLDHLIGQAIEMAKLDSQSLRLEIQPQDVRELIELTVEHMQSTLQQHPIQIEVPAKLPAVRMDRSLMQRVLQHLLENAAVYSPPKEPITIAARIEENRLLIAISDRGPGIDADELPFIFDKYYRGKRQKGSVRGTGMGLAIVRAILRTHQGDISVVSSPECGTCFTFWIPFNDLP